MTHYENLRQPFAGGLRSYPELADFLTQTDTKVVYKTVEQMYGMLWYLAQQLEANEVYGSKEDALEEARKFFKDGLYASPTPRYREST